MRILMVAQFYPPTVGGEERVVHDLSVELADRGHDVAVATLHHEGLPEYEERDGVRIHRIRSTASRLGSIYADPGRHHAPPLADPEATAGLRRVATEERPDVVHGHNWLVHSYLPLKRRTGPALVVSLHDYRLVCSNKRLMRWGWQPCSGPGLVKCLDCSTAYYSRAKGPAITVANWVMSAAERSLVDLFLPVSTAVALASGVIRSRAPHRVIPNFLRGAGAVGSPDRAVLSRLPPRFALFVGDVTADKGAFVAIRAHAGIADAVPLVLIGRTAGARRAAMPNVHLLGPLPHHAVLQAWRAAEVALVPSIVPEAFGLVALEAMAAGRPVVASRTGGLGDIVADGETGFLVAPGDVEGVRTALARLLRDDELRTRMSAAAVARAELFTASRTVPRVESAYASVTASRPRPRATLRRAASSAGMRVR